MLNIRFCFVLKYDYEPNHILLLTDYSEVETGLLQGCRLIYLVMKATVDTMLVPYLLFLCCRLVGLIYKLLQFWNFVFCHLLLYILYNRVLSVIYITRIRFLFAYLHVPYTREAGTMPQCDPGSLKVFICPLMVSKAAANTKVN